MFFFKQLHLVWFADVFLALKTLSSDGLSSQNLRPEILGPPQLYLISKRHADGPCKCIYVYIIY